MQKRNSFITLRILLLLTVSMILQHVTGQSEFAIRNEYFDKPGLSVLVFNDSYTEGHQGGIQIIQHEDRVAANGDLRLEPAPGQWQAFSQMNGKAIDTLQTEIIVSLSYPNEKAQSRKFNRIEYPNLAFSYKVRVQTDSHTFKVVVDIDKPLPKEWIGKVGFNLELFPGNLFDRKYILDGVTGQFPRQFNGPIEVTDDDQNEIAPMAEG